jgi:hypothetical protein
MPSITAIRAPSTPSTHFGTLYYSRNRVADYPRDHLVGYAGIMQADAFVGFNGL